MQYVTLGKTGLRVSRLGFGGIPIQRADALSVPAILHAASERGINFIDTAKGYTVSESYIGAGIEGIREKFVVATKSMSRDAAGMERDIADSLVKLRTDHIDLYQFHNLDPKGLARVQEPDGALSALLKAKDEGKIAHIGVTTHYTEVFRQVIELPWVETVMFPYNLVETQGAELVKLCRERGVGFIAMKPFAGGAIENAPLALRYLLADTGVDVALAGMYSEAEVKENADAAESAAPLTDADEREIARIRDSLGENFCRRCNYCAPCTAGIAIPQVFLFGGYLERYGLAGWARDRYNAMEKRAGDCIGCGVCETRCPYHLPIRELMRKHAKMFGS